jgi:hypothetical protein
MVCRVVLVVVDVDVVGPVCCRVVRLSRGGLLPFLLPWRLALQHQRDGMW